MTKAQDQAGGESLDGTGCERCAADGLYRLVFRGAQRLGGRGDSAEIAADLSVDTGQLSWLMTGFLLVYGIAIPLYGRLADRYGARPLFLLGVAVFSFKNALDWLQLLSDRVPPYLANKGVGAGQHCGRGAGASGREHDGFCRKSLRGWAVPLVIPVPSGVAGLRRPGESP